jgi:FkbM family methyltransferase
LTVFRSLKQIFVAPFSRRARTVLIGKSDQWAILAGSISNDSFIVSAGVGHSISFEEELVERFNAHIVLLDPSPTGLKTIASKKDMRNIEFRKLGLAATPGEVRFGLPDQADEGSFRKGGDDDGVSFACTSLSDLIHEHGGREVDLLKIDVEGFEYEIIQSIIDEKLAVKQICVEIHHNRVISLDKTIFDAMALILKLAMSDYRIIYNKNMDFTFVKKQMISQSA